MVVSSNDGRGFASAAGALNWDKMIYDARRHFIDDMNTLAGQIGLTRRIFHETGLDTGTTYGGCVSTGRGHLLHYALKNIQHLRRHSSSTTARTSLVNGLPSRTPVRIPTSLYRIFLALSPQTALPTRWRQLIGPFDAGVNRPIILSSRLDRLTVYRCGKLASSTLALSRRTHKIDIDIHTDQGRALYPDSFRPALNISDT